MITVNLKTLRHDFRKVEKLIQAGEEVWISKRGRIVMRLLPPTPRNKRKKIKMPDFEKRLKAIFPRGPIHGDPQAFWDEIRGE